MGTVQPLRASPAAAARPTLLEVRGVVVRFGGIVALDKVSFEIMEHEVLGLIGPNGAGKTTMFNCLSRLYTPNEGSIVFDGQPILQRAPHRMAEAGIGRTFQNVALFRTLTVLQNVMIGGHTRTRGDFFSDALALPWSRRANRALETAAWEAIDYLDLQDVAHLPVAGLPFGTQKRVELARALTSRPRLLLLDEPAGGLNHEEVDELGRLIRQIRDDRGVTVLLVEHHMSLVMAVSDRVVALDFGRKIAQGTPAEIQRNEDVIRAYLGTEGG